MHIMWRMLNTISRIEHISIMASIQLFITNGMWSMIHTRINEKVSRAKLSQRRCRMHSIAQCRRHNLRLACRSFGALRALPSLCSSFFRSVSLDTHTAQKALSISASSEIPFIVFRETRECEKIGWRRSTFDVRRSSLPHRFQSSKLFKFAEGSVNSCSECSH